MCCVYGVTVRLTEMNNGTFAHINYSFLSGKVSAFHLVLVEAFDEASCSTSTSFHVYNVFIILRMSVMGSQLHDSNPIVFHCLKCQLVMISRDKNLNVFICADDFFVIKKRNLLYKNRYLNFIHSDFQTI